MSRNWNPNARKVAEEIERKFFGGRQACSTYPDHGRPGEYWSIDIWVAPFRQKANAEQEALGDRIQKYIEANWNRLGIDYLIWWNWWKEGPNEPWVSYEHEAFKWPYGDPDPDTRRHLDHLHISHHPGFTYRPPKEGSSVSNFTPSSPVKWYPASESNYTVGRGVAVDRVVLHVTGGSFGSAVNTFQNGANQVSAHYLIRSSDGHVGQLVSELNTAWHAGAWPTNERSIGIEHEAVKGQPGYLTNAMLNSSITLVADICKRHNIPPDGQHIIFHREATNTECPTPFWDKGRYVQMVREKMTSTPTPAPTPPTDDNDSLFGPVRFTKEQAVAATKVIYPDANMVRCRAAARAIYATIHPSFVRPDFRYAQFLWETRRGLYGGDSEWPNFAGIKKGPKERGGDVGDEPIDFLVPRNGMLSAHIQALHMVAYTKTPLPRNPDPIHERFWVAKQARASQPAVTRISQLGGGAWATDPDYAKHLRTLMDRLETTAKEMEVAEQQGPPEQYLPPESHGSSDGDAPNRSLAAEPVLWGTAAKSIVTLFAIVSSAYGVDVASDVQESLIVLLGVALPALAALIGIGVAERQSVTPVDRK